MTLLVHVMKRRDQLIGQVNDVPSTFRKLDPIVKTALLYRYCSSMYGSVLWDLQMSDISRICSAWRFAIRQILNFKLEAIPCISFPGEVYFDRSLGFRLPGFQHQSLMIAVERELITLSDYARITHLATLFRSIDVCLRGVV